MSENRVMRRIFVRKRVEEAEVWKKSVMRSFRICTLFTEYVIK